MSFLRHLLPGRRFWKLFLLSLPVTLLPIILGIGDAFLRIYHENARVYRNTQRFIDNVENEIIFKSIHNYEPVNILGRPFGPNIYPFGIVQLRVANWYQKLGFSKPKDDTTESSGIDLTAAFDNLYKEVDSYSTPQSDRWIWLSESPSLLLPWDAAFKQLLEYYEYNEAAGNATFHYIDCAETSFLCGFWGIKPPSLLHFSVDNVDEWNNSREPVTLENDIMTRPVSVRVVKLGLDFFKPGIFPTEFEQLLFVTSGEYSPESFPKYDQNDVIQHEVWELLDIARSASRPFDFVHCIDDWIQENAPTVVDYSLGFIRVHVELITALVVSIPVLMVLKLWELVGGYGTFDNVHPSQVNAHFAWD